MRVHVAAVRQHGHHRHATQIGRTTLLLTTEHFARELRRTAASRMTLRRNRTARAHRERIVQRGDLRDGHDQVARLCSQ